MSHADHEWARELIAAHLAGGLNAEERARMEAHVAGCAECIAEINEARRFEHGLEAAFVPIRPSPGLEERVIRKLRTAPASRPWGLFGKLLTAAAAAGLLGAVGYAILEMDDPFQGKIQQSLSGGEALARTTRDNGRYDGRWAEGRDRHLGRLDDSVEELTDHNEAADEKSYGKTKGDSLDKDMVGAPNRFGGVPAPTVPPSPGESVLVLKEMEKLERAQEGQNRQFYNYRENAPAKPADPAYFKLNNAGPGVAGNKKLEDLAKATVPEPGKPRQPQGGVEGKGGQAAPQNDPAPQPVRKIIRSGEVEFEVESFDSTVAVIQKIAGEERGFIATVNSEKLANGKVRGSVVVRVPPDNLDTLLLKLRALGELKSQRIGSQDVTKAFYDSESRLRAARAMEERLLKIIKEGKGEIKDLLLAEKELGEWRTRIETAEGEIRYYNSLINLSTLTITLQEKEIRAASGVVRTERVDMAVEVEDVEKAHRDALAAIAEAKGRVTRSELKQHAAGQLSSILRFEVAPTASGTLRDRLRQLGTPARMDVNVLEENEGGPVRAGTEIRVTQKDSQFSVSIYNLANIQPRETTHLQLANLDVEKAYKDILARVERAGGRVVTSQLNRQRNDQTTATLHVEVKSGEAEAVLLDVRSTGEVMQFTTTENPDVQNVTRSKRGIQINLFAMGHVMPRETTKLTVAAKEVAAAYRLLVEAARKAEAWVLASHLVESDPQNVRATLNLDVRRDQEPVIVAALGAAGTVYSRTSQQAAPNSGAVEMKSRFEISLFDRSKIQPRETHSVGVEVSQVEASTTLVEKIAAEGKGTVEDVNHHRDSRSGRQVSVYTLRVPLSEAGATLERLKALGTVKEQSGAKNPAVPLNDVAVAKVVVTLSNDLILSPEAGPIANIKRGLGVSLTALSYALMLIMIGVCFVLPIAAIAYGGVRIYKKVKAKPA